MNIISEPLPGIYLIEMQKFEDSRGLFVKVYQNSKSFLSDLEFTPEEIFYTYSKKDTIRGMHFQVLEAAHDKFITCQHGSVLDVVVDINPKSNSFNQPYSVNLSGSNNLGLFISKGYAHGFLALEDQSLMLYGTSTCHSPQLDKGVLWSSIDFQWPVKNPILSSRDMSHPEILSL